MASVIVVGDGPGGLSAALFLAKNKQDVTVFAQNGTWMNSALLFNYLSGFITFQLVNTPADPGF